MCDTYDKWIKRRSTELLFNQTEIYYEYQFYQSLVQSLIEIIIYPLSIYFFLLIFNAFEQTRWAFEKNRFNMFIKLTQSGFYGNIFL